MDAIGRGLKDAARQLCYHFFSTVMSDPRSKSWERLRDTTYIEALLTAADHLRTEAGGAGEALAPGERAPGELSLEAPLAVLRRYSTAQVEQEYRRVFGFLLAKDCPPYETEYCPQTFSVYRSQKLGDVAGYYRAFGLEPSRETPERHDHISLEMEFMAWVIGKERHARAQGGIGFEERAEICQEAQVRFFEEHMGWWTPAFAMALREKADGRKTWTGLDGVPCSLYGAVGDVLPAFMAFERVYLGVAAPRDLVAPMPAGEPDMMDCAGCEVAAGGLFRGPQGPTPEGTLESG